MIDKYERRNKKIKNLDCYDDLFWDDERMKKAYTNTDNSIIPGFYTFGYYDYIIDYYHHKEKELINNFNEDLHKKINKIWEKQGYIGDSLHDIRKDIINNYYLNMEILNWYNELLENPALPLSSALSLSSATEEINESIENCDGQKDSFVMYSSLQINETLKELYLLKDHLLANSNKYNISNFKPLFESYYTYINSSINEYTEKMNEWKSEDINCEEVFLKYKYQILNEMDFLYSAPYNTINFRQTKDGDFDMDYVEDSNLFCLLEKTLLPIIQDSLTDNEQDTFLKYSHEKQYNNMIYTESLPDFHAADFYHFKKEKEAYNWDALNWDCNKTLEIILDEMDRKLREFHLLKNHFESNHDKYNL